MHKESYVPEFLVVGQIRFLLCLPISERFQSNLALTEGIVHVGVDLVANREVSDEQQERNQERVDHVSSILSELEERVENPTEWMETAKELLSVAGSEMWTEGCNVVLSDCLKLLRESAEDAGLAEYYREQIEEIPDETVSESPSVGYCRLYGRIDGDSHASKYDEWDYTVVASQQHSLVYPLRLQPKSNTGV